MEFLINEIHSFNPSPTHVIPGASTAAGSSGISRPRSFLCDWLHDYLLRYGDSSTWVITQAWPYCLSRYQLLAIFFTSAQWTAGTSLLHAMYTKPFVSVVTCTCGREWALDGMPEVHDSQEKRRFISCVEVFHCETGDWICQPTNGAPPLAVCAYGCTAVGDTLHFFGGDCYHDKCFHNSIHSLSTSSLLDGVITHHMHIRGWGTDEKGLLWYSSI